MADDDGCAVDRRAAVGTATGGWAMTDFPNAPAPPGALFDNAPTLAAPVPAHLTPATRISMVKGGKWIGVEVFMQYGKPIPLELALRRVALGRTVFVAREDAGKVMEAVGNSGAQG